MSKMASMADGYNPSGAHVYDGILMVDGFPAEQLDKVKEFDFCSTDVLIATYPKAGQSVSGSVSQWLSQWLSQSVQSVSE